VSLLDNNSRELDNKLIYFVCISNSVQRMFYLTRFKFITQLRKVLLIFKIDIKVTINHGNLRGKYKRDKVLI